MTQQNKVPLKVWNNNVNIPLLLYLSGDAGLNSFSNSYCDLLSKEGYTVAAVNSKSYFWNKKSPAQMAEELSATISKLMEGRKNQLVYFIGYSFGADVIPFLVNRLAHPLKQKLQSVTLIEPSASTDLEIHVSDLLGRSNVTRSMDVVAEINKMSGTKTVILLGEEASSFPIKQVRLAGVQTVYLKGNHYFRGNALTLVKATVKSF